MNEITLYPEWKQAVHDAVEEFDYGDTISHEWLHAHFDIKMLERGTAMEFREVQFKFLAYTEAFKAALLENHKMLLKSSRGIGYLVVLPEDQTGIAIKACRQRIMKELSRANGALVNIQLEMLSAEARRENSNRLAQLAAIRTFNRKELKNERHDAVRSGEENQISNGNAGKNHPGKVDEKKEEK